MDLNRKKIGIWGLGISGRSTLKYLLKTVKNITILEKNIRKSEANNSFIEDTPGNRKKFLEENDLIIPSPGVDLNSYAEFSKKFYPSIDLFFKEWQKPIVSITGTLGKTSITHILSSILMEYGMNIAVGGNIGIGLMDLVENKKNKDFAILELSSFQLEHAKIFSPNVSVWTNFYPNHLDRHRTIKSYFDAKKHNFLYQNKDQKCILPIEIIDELRKDPSFKDRPFSIISTNEKLIKNKNIKSFDTIFYLDSENNILKNGKIIISFKDIPKISYKSNWLIVAAILHEINLDPRELIIEFGHKIKLPKNRLEHVKTVNGIKFYNDSKSTIMQSTVAAVKEIKNGEIILMLGGTSKSIDRSVYIEQLKDKTKNVICFGAEAELLKNSCKKNSIKAESHSTLETAIKSAYKQSKPGYSILFSPGGASFDLFKNYEERGEKFKELVLLLNSE